MPGTDDQYTLELGEEHIAKARGDIDRLAEYHAQDNAGFTPNTPASGYGMYSASGQQKYIGADAGTYNTGRNTLLPTSAPVINSTTFTDIPNLQAPLGAAPNYRISGQVICNPANSAVSAQLQFAGTGGLAIGGNSRIVFWEWTQQNVINWGNSAEITALATAFTGNQFGAGLNDHVIQFDGTIFGATAGTISLQAAISAGGNSYTIRRGGTYLEIMPIT